MGLLQYGMYAPKLILSLNTLRPHKMDAIFQTTFSNRFCWMKMHEVRLKFRRSLFLSVQLTIFQHWFRLWLGADQATSHYLSQWWLVYRRIHASLGLNELNTNFANLVHSIIIIGTIALKICIKHGSMTVVLCTKLQNDLKTNHLRDKSSRRVGQKYSLCNSPGFVCSGLVSV